MNKFKGNGKQLTKYHMNSFNSTCGVLDVLIEDVVVRIFVQTLIAFDIDWFHHLPHASIQNWNEMIVSFEVRFKVVEDEHTLLM